MEKYDFIFIYEHKVRELENLCLMKYELDKRGYKTKIIYVEDAANAIEPRPIYETRVLCVMACYDNGTLRWHVKNFIKFDKVIDLQWENIVYVKDEDREDAYKNYRGIGKEVVHLSWGEQNVKRLLNAAHLDPKKVKLTGHVGMDFLREPLSRYYTSREELFAKYDLPMDKKVILFASPYYGDCLDDKYIAEMCMRFGDDWPEYYNFMCESQLIVLDWFEKLCKAQPDTVIVFRPHPGHPSLAAEKLAQKCNNFRIISGESVKQWIVVCDGVYTGNSSVVVEAFFARKMCLLLFPLPTTKGFELQMITDSDKITSFEDFMASVDNDNNQFPTPVKDIEYTYLIDWEKANYIKFADMAEEVLKDDYYRLTRKQLKEFREYTGTDKLIRFICNHKLLYDMYMALINNPRVSMSLIANQRALRAQNISKMQKIELEHQHELTSEEEIDRIISRIKYAIEG